MRVFLIDDGRIAVHAKAPKNLSEGAVLIRSEADLEASAFDARQLVALWNGLPGVEPVKKFKDRKTAVRRLWKRLQDLPAKPEKAPRREPRGRTRGTSKQAKVVEMLKRPQGATVDEIAKVTGWQRHTVRGLIAGALKKKLGLDIVAANEEKGRVYRVAA
jgi:hypothetical protein